MPRNMDRGRESKLDKQAAVGPPRLELLGLSKHFPGVKANDEVSFEIRRGEIHALLGENGAGKSTLLKMIFGLLKPDAGQIKWEGRIIQIGSPRHAQSLGMGMVQQHFALLESLSVAENLALTLNRRGRFDLERIVHQIEAAANEYGLKVPARRPVHHLSVGERQRVEILRCLLQEEPLRLLILDEPTSVLTPQESKALFAVLRNLAADGLSILFVSHKLEEVRALCDRVTVLRKGEVVARLDSAKEAVDELARLMVGEAPPPLLLSEKRKDAGPVRLQVEGLNLPAADPHGMPLRNINLELRSGEILGLAGVSGNGQAELLAALTGERRSPTKSILIDGLPVGYLDVRARRRLGLRYVPEERVGKGVVPELSLIDNGLLTRWGRFLKKGWMRSREARESAWRLCERHHVRQTGVEHPAASLSGGNLQKFIMGRELDEQPTIFIAAQPTWGVDVASARRIQSQLLELRARGAALMVISDDLEELLALSDRIAVMSGGRISPVRSIDGIDRKELGRWMGAGREGWESLNDVA